MPVLAGWAVGVSFWARMHKGPYFSSLDLLLNDQPHMSNLSNSAACEINTRSLKFRRREDTAVLILPFQSPISVAIFSDRPASDLGMEGEGGSGGCVTKITEKYGMHGSVAELLGVSAFLKGVESERLKQIQSVDHRQWATLRTGQVWCFGEVIWRRTLSDPVVILCDPMDEKGARESVDEVHMVRR
ncbi:hypothetical protein K438DRAFT_1769714 [Mycena galopus ATCC 62051]|nr:hypothetical protein K438DRAFT_1769714 [Mycena galopus ATCC 62051]